MSSSDPEVALGALDGQEHKERSALDPALDPALDLDDAYVLDLGHPAPEGIPNPVPGGTSDTGAGPAPQTLISRTKRHLGTMVRTSTLADIELLILTFCTGLQDAISFPDYGCFGSNQTGNTVLLAVAVFMPEFNGKLFYTANVAVALCFFLAGACLTGQVSHIVGPRLRLWLIVSNAVQTGMVLAAAMLQRVYGVHHSRREDLIALGLLAFASGSQVVQSRSLKMTEISTAMATAAWVDLVIDPHLLAVRKVNRSRDRRLLFLLVLAGGSMVGAAILKWVGSDAALLLSAGGKALVTLMYFFNGAVKGTEVETKADDNVN